MDTQRGIPPIPAIPPLPIVSRENLQFQHAVAFGLQLRVYTGLVTNLTIRGYTKAGLFTFKYTTGSAGGLETANFRLTDIPIAVSVTTGDTAISEAECFVSLNLTANTDILEELCAGYVSTTRGISYPVTNQKGPIFYHGRLKSVSDADPAAGSEFSIQMPTSAIWRLLSIRITLVTDGTVANRRVTLFIDTPAATTVCTASGVDQTAGQTIQYCFAPFGFGPTAISNNKILVPLPVDLWLPPNSYIYSLGSNLQAGDNFGAPDALVEQFRSPVA